MSWTVNGTPIDLLSASATLTLGASGDSCSLRTYTDLGLTLNAEVVVRYNGAIFFSGLCRRWAIDSAAAQVAYLLEIGSWWQILEEIVVTQEWPCAETNTPKSKSRVVLCSGTRTTTTELAAVLAQLGGAIGFSVTLPDFVAPMPMELLDKSVAEAVNDLLRWHPDALVYIDYSTHPATLKISNRADLVPVSFAYSGTEAARGVSGSFVTLTPTPVEGVVVTYEVRKTVDDAEYWDIIEDTAGATSGRRVVRHTIPLNGPTITTIPGQSATIETDDVPEDHNASNVKTWLRRNVPELAEITAADTADLEVLSLTHEFEAWDPEDGDQPDTAPRELTDGVFYDWMPDFWAQPVLITVQARWIGASGAKADAFGPTRTRTFYIQITGTNATTGTHHRPSGASVDPGETVPVGVAQHIYETRITAGPTGGATLTLDEPDCTLRAGQLLNLTGEIAVTGALIQTLTRNHAGQTTFQCGPAGQLATPDLFLRQQRSSARAHRYHSDRGELDSAATDGTSIDGPRRLPRGPGANPPSSPEVWSFKCTLDGVSGSSKLVRVAPGTVYAPSWPGTIDPEDPKPFTWVAASAVPTSQQTVLTGQTIYLRLTAARILYDSSGPFIDYPTEGTDVPSRANVSGNTWQLTAADIVVGLTSTPPDSTDLITHIPLADLSGSTLTHRHLGDYYFWLPVTPFINPVPSP